MLVSLSFTPLLCFSACVLPETVETDPWLCSVKQTIQSFSFLPQVWTSIIFLVFCFLLTPFLLWIPSQFPSVRRNSVWRQSLPSILSLLVWKQDLTVEFCVGFTDSESSSSPRFFGGTEGNLWTWDRNSKWVSLFAFDHFASERKLYSEASFTGGESKVDLSFSRRMQLKARFHVQYRRQRERMISRKTLSKWLWGFSLEWGGRCNPFFISVFCTHRRCLWETFLQWSHQICCWFSFVNFPLLLLHFREEKRLWWWWGLRTWWVKVKCICDRLRIGDAAGADENNRSL